ncbi:hypothetical protein ACSBR1_034793 [Camellia fascicularis]
MGLSVDDMSEDELGLELRKRELGALLQKGVPGRAAMLAIVGSAREVDGTRVWGTTTGDCGVSWGFAEEREDKSLVVYSVMQCEFIHYRTH